MIREGPTHEEVPRDTRPAAILVAGFRRGALLVFVPVFLAGEVIALGAYVLTGWNDVWTWGRAGLALTITSVRVPFDAVVGTAGGAAEAGRLLLATGALTVAVLVLSFRAGRDQARGLESRPVGAAGGGAAVGLGFAVPAFVAALGSTLVIDRFGIDRLQPVRWQAFALPVIVASAAGGFGALGAAREAVTDRVGPRVAAVVRGGATAFWWGIVLSFVAVLVVAALSPREVGAYARALDRADGAGAAATVEQALLIPNASALVLATSMGATTTLTIGEHGTVALTRGGIEANGAAGGFVLAVLGVARAGVLRSPWWFAGLVLVPLIATLVGGRAAASGASGTAERVLRGAASAAVFAVLCAVAVWAASITVPTWSVGRAEELTLGASPLAVGILGLAWGAIGGAIGGAIPGPSGRFSADRE